MSLFPMASSATRLPNLLRLLALKEVADTIEASAALKRKATPES